MDDVLQKEFQFSDVDSLRCYEGSIPVFTVRQATLEDNQLRKDKLLELQTEYSSFIKDGYKFVKHKSLIDWGIYRNWLRTDDDENFVDDSNLRFWYIINTLNLEDKIRHIEIQLVLISCNLLSRDNKIPLMEYRNGRSYYNGGLSMREQEQVYKRVIEMNPPWSGEFKRMGNKLYALTRPKSAIRSQGNFKDLAVKTVFVKNKGYLKSLLDEILEDVFDHEGEIQVNIPINPLGKYSGEYNHVFKQSDPPFENIILFPGSPNSSGDYIGVIEHGNNEIRVIAQRTEALFRERVTYWDAFIDEIIPTLRSAIEWWKEKPRKYTDEEIDAMRELDEDTSWMDEAKAVYDDFLEDDFLDDD